MRTAEAYRHEGAFGVPKEVVPVNSIEASVSTNTHRRDKMKRISIVCLTLVIGLAFSVSAAYAEMAKEGSGQYRGGKSGKISVMKLGEGRLQLNWDETGVMVDAPENSPFVNASFRSMGTIHSIEGKTEGNGAITFTCPNGDQIFGVINMGGKYMEGPTRGIIEFIGGTGQCAGIEGQIEMMPRPKIAPSMDGTYQQIGIGKVSWKLP